MGTPFVAASITGAATSNVTGWNVTLPPHVPGDLLFVLTTRNANATIYTPSGWTVLVDTAIGSGDWMQVACKEARTQEPDAVTFTSNTAERCVWVAFSVRNHLGIDAVSTASSGSSSTPSFPSVTSNQNNALILTFLGARLETTPHTQPNGYTEIAETSYASAGSASAAWMVKASAGSETPGNATMNSATAWGTFTLAVAPGGKFSSYTLYPAKDARIISGSTYMDLNFGANDRLGIGEHRAAVQTQRTLIQFEHLSSLPPSTPVDTCEFSFVLNTDQSDNDSTYSIYRLKRSWVEGTQNGSGTPNGATWNTYNGTNAWTSAGAFDSADCEQTPIGSFTISASATPGTRIVVDLSASVSTIADLDLGYGWLIKADTENNNLWEINSNEHATATARPELFIQETLVTGQTYVDVFSSSGTWTCPAGVTSVTAEAIGGGAKALGNTGTNQSPTNGAGGGAYARGTVTVTPGNNYTVTVGAAIASSTGINQAGNPSSFVGDGGGSNQVYADGGRGLASNCIYNIVAYNGGAGGSFESSTYTCGGGGGGGGAGRNGAGSAGGIGVLSTGAGGAGGGGGWLDPTQGRGGNGMTGNAGAGGGLGQNTGLSAPGGGGGGAGGGVGSTSRTGGGGAAGEVRIIWLVSSANAPKFMHHQRMMR